MRGLVPGLLILCAACKGERPAPEPAGATSAAMVTAPSASSSPPPVVSASATQAPITDLVVGTGKEAKDGSKVKVHYTLWLESGTRVESSHDKGKPKSFVLGAGQMIKGWDAGIPGMKVGGKRKLVIPAVLGYGSKGALPSIPPNAVLVFEIELLEVG